MSQTAPIPLCTMTPTNLTPRVERIFQLARRAADSASAALINSEHLVLGLLEEGKGGAKTLAEVYGKDIEDLKRAFKEAMTPKQEPKAEPAPKPQRAPRPTPQEPEVDRSLIRYYLLVDDSVGWICQLAKVYDYPDHTSHPANDMLDVPNSLGAAFLDNLFQREPVKGTMSFGCGDGWTAWSISPAEYQRVKDLIELHPYVEKARKLGEGL